MKKIILSSVILMAANSLSATKFMHINLPDGKVHDVKIEKTDRVMHLQTDTTNFIKLLRTDGSFSLYPLEGAEVTFGDTISMEEKSISHWMATPNLIDGCELDTAGYSLALEEGPYDKIREYEEAFSDYESCLSQKKNSFDVNLNRETTLQDSANLQAAKLLKAAIEANEDEKVENFLMSPTSLQMALAMVANGTDDEEAYREITKYIGKEGMPLDSINDWFRRKYLNMKTEKPDRLTIGLSNGCFLADGKNFGKEFIQNLNDYYWASTCNVNFSEDSTYSLINNWVEEATNKMIPSIIDKEKKDNYDCILVNALSFQSEWDDKFSYDNTKKGAFTTAKGEQIQVEKMNGGFIYGETDDYQLTTLNFHENYEMNIILPREGKSPAELLATLDFGKINYKRDRNITYLAVLQLPKFKISSNIDLRKVMNTMGSHKIFETTYDRITPNTYISGAVQKNKLEIDEDGAKGAAVTTVEYLPIGEPDYKKVDFDVNRPFIVTVRNRGTHELLFLGVINNPSIE